MVSRPAAWSRLVACAGAAALLQLDGTVITVALPSVAHGLRVSGATTSLVLSTYFAAYALTLAPGGVLVDRLGTRRVAICGLALFAAGAAAGASGASVGALVATRVVQGAGAGLVSPAALAGAISGFPPHERGRALGLWGASAGVANLVGPLLGGLLTVALGWRADFWVLVPLAFAAALAITTRVPRIETSSPPRITESVLTPAVMASAVLASLTFAVMIGSFYIAQQYLQRTAGYSALLASSVLALVALLVAVAAPVAGRLVDRWGERLPAAAGFLAAGSGLLVLAWPSVSLDDAATLGLLIPVGIGLGMLFVPVSRAALNATPTALHGRTSALLSGGRLLGAAIGAGLGGLALADGAGAARVHHALLAAGAACVAIGVPASRLLRSKHAPPVAPDARAAGGTSAAAVPPIRDDEVTSLL